MRFISHICVTNAYCRAKVSVVLESPIHRVILAIFCVETELGKAITGLFSFVHSLRFVFVISLLTVFNALVKLQERQPAT